MLHAWKIFLALAVILAGVSTAVFANPSDLLVNVVTDGVVYQSGDTVNVQVETFLNGELTKAYITKAILTITLPNGQKVKNDIKDDFKMISPGVFAASGKVKSPGPRTLEITAEVVKHVTCKCKIVKIANYGFATYDVEAIPLAVAINVDNVSPSICDTVEVTIVVNHSADIQIVAIFPNGAQKHLVIPSWVEAGEHRIKVSFDNLDIGEVLIKVNAYDHYGQNAMAGVYVNVGYGECDCPEDHGH